MEVDDIKRQVVPVLARHNITEAYLFGSAARGEARPDSDIDILARFNGLKNLFDYMRVKYDLEDALGGRPVDLVQMEALRQEYADTVEEDKIQLV
jgi:predicted nucleotidyltransferase